MNLRSVAIVGWIKQNDLISLVEETEEDAEEGFRSTLSCADAVLMINLSKSFFVELSNSLSVAKRPKRSNILMVSIEYSFSKKFAIEFCRLPGGKSLSKIDGLGFDSKRIHDRPDTRLVKAEES